MCSRFPESFFLVLLLQNVLTHILRRRERKGEERDFLLHLRAESTNKSPYIAYCLGRCSLKGDSVDSHRTVESAMTDSPSARRIKSNSACLCRSRSSTRNLWDVSLASGSSSAGFFGFCIAEVLAPVLLTLGSNIACWPAPILPAGQLQHCLLAGSNFACWPAPILPAGQLQHCLLASSNIACWPAPTLPAGQLQLCLLACSNFACWPAPTLPAGQLQLCLLASSNIACWPAPTLPADRLQLCLLACSNIACWPAPTRLA